MDKGDERKKQLLQVALDVFIEKGYYGTSNENRYRNSNGSALRIPFSNDKEYI